MRLVAPLERGPRPRRVDRAQRVPLLGRVGARSSPSPASSRVAALDHYRRVAEGCRRRGLVPVVTLHHFTLPRWMAERGGFESPEIAERLGAYAARVGDALGDAIGIACTINEPNIVALMGYLARRLPAEGARPRRASRPVSATMRASHRAMVDALRAGPGRTRSGSRSRWPRWRPSRAARRSSPKAIEHLEDAYLATCAATTSSASSATRGCASGPTARVDVPEGARRTKMGYEYRPEAVEHTSGARRR